MITREEMLKFWARHYRDWHHGSEIVVYPNVRHAKGMPRLADMRELALAMEAEIVHMGRGVYAAMDKVGIEVFSFCAERAMTVGPVGVGPFSFLIRSDPSRSMLVATRLRKIAPAGFEECDRLDAKGAKSEAEHAEHQAALRASKMRYWEQMARFASLRIRQIKRDDNQAAGGKK